MNRGLGDQLVGRRVTAIGAWASRVVDVASRSRASVVLATDNGMALRAGDRELAVIVDRAAPRPGAGTAVVWAVRNLIDARSGTWRGLDITLSNRLPFTGEGQRHRFVIVAEGNGEYAVYAVPSAISLPPHPTWPLQPRAVRSMDYEQDWLWGASAVLPIVSPLSGEIRLAVVGQSRGEALFCDESELYVASFDSAISPAAIAGLGGKEVWDYSVDETQNEIVLELSDPTHQFSSVIAEYLDGGIGIHQCLKVEVPR